MTLEEILGPEDDATCAVAKIFGISEVDARARLGGLAEDPLALTGVKVVIDEAKAFLAERGIVVHVERDH